GTIGAGKGTIVDYLVRQKDFSHYSVRAFLIEEIKKRNLPVNRDTMTSVANELRAENSPSYIIDRLYDSARQSGDNCVIESIRTPGEIDSLRKKNGFTLFAVDAPAEVRYQRIKARASETDSVDFETFLQNEKREMSTDDPNKQNLQKCISKADYVFKNTGTISQLESLVDQVLEKIRKKQNDTGHLRRRFCPRA
ncbi:MAG: AAA family ATPase, partial [Bacteroidales bacterium]